MPAERWIQSSGSSPTTPATAPPQTMANVAPVLSAMSLKECREPSARTRLAAATISWTCSSVDGWWMRSAR